MKTRGLLTLLAAALVALGGCTNSRFGDPDVLDQIESSTDCDELQKWADGILTVDASDKRAFDQAVGYANAANDRMEAVGC